MYFRNNRWFFALLLLLSPFFIEAQEYSVLDLKRASIDKKLTADFQKRSQDQLVAYSIIGKLYKDDPLNNSSTKANITVVRKSKDRLNRKVEEFIHILLKDGFERLLMENPALGDQNLREEWGTSKLLLDIVYVQLQDIGGEKQYVVDLEFHWKSVDIIGIGLDLFEAGKKGKEALGKKGDGLIEDLLEGGDHLLDAETLVIKEEYQTQLLYDADWNLIEQEVSVVEKQDTMTSSSAMYQPRQNTSSEAWQQLAYPLTNMPAIPSEDKVLIRHPNGVTILINPNQNKYSIHDIVGRKVDFEGNQYIIVNEIMLRRMAVSQQDVYQVVTSLVTDMNNLFSNSSLGYEYYENGVFSTWDVSNVTNMRSMFASTEIYNAGLEHWDVSQVMDMSRMFYKTPYFNDNISLWNVSNVRDMHWMFSEAKGFNQPISLWDVSRVTSMNSMFYEADSFNQPLTLWDVSSVTDMSYMFYYNNSFDQPLNSWKVDKVTGCNQFRASGWALNAGHVPHFTKCTP